MENQEVIEVIKGKRILYIATKNSDYIRIQQEIKLIEKYALKSTIIVSKEKSYPKRIFDVYKNIIKVHFEEYDTIFVGFMAQMIVPFVRWKFKRKELIVDFFISIFDTLVDDRKKVKNGSVFAKFIHKVDQITIANADYIVCDTNSHGKYFAEEFGVPISKFHTLYLEADITFYHPMKIERPKMWKDKFLVLFFGSILPVQGVEVILEAIDKLKEEKQIHFLVIGPINKKNQKISSDNVTYIDWLSQENLAKYISYADLCLAGHFSSEVNKAKRTIPGKAYIYDAMGKAMVLGDTLANHELFREDKRHSFVPVGSSEKLAEIISEKRKQIP